MLVYATVRQAGKRRDLLVKREYELPNTPLTLKDVLTQIVKKNVIAFNLGETDDNLQQLLSKDEMEEAASIGKVGGERRKNEAKQDMIQAIENALLSFEDGIYRVFMDEKEIESLDTVPDVKEGSEFVFIKLTMLAGRLW